MTTIYPTILPTKHRYSSFLRVSLCLLAVLTHVGCGGTKSSVVSKEKSHLRILARAYDGFVIEKSQRPNDEAEFKAYVQNSMGPPVLERYGITSVEELYVSERDGQPLVFLYGKQPKSVDEHVVGYEQTGVDGNRWVVFDLGNIEEVDETRFRELIPNAP